METEILKRLFLEKLIRRNVWGGKHIPLDFLIKSAPEHSRNNHQGQKAIAGTLKELVNIEWIIITYKRTGNSSEEHISLNPRKVSEIRQYLGINNS